jgi:phosphatidylglycerophosphate synthase
VRTLATLIPVCLAAAYVAATATIYALRLRLTGRHVDDANVAKAHESYFAPRWLVAYLPWALGPVERLFMRLRVSPNALTFGSLSMAALAAVALGFGHFAAGGWLFLFTGALDLFDGRIARATGRVTASGAFYDSVIDRYAEGLLFAGLAVYYRHDFVLYVVLACMISSYMVSYTRARGESLGVCSDRGTMQRPERIVALGFGLALSPVLGLVLEPAAFHPLHHLAIGALAFVALSASTTALQRFAHVFGLLRQRDTSPVVESPRRVAAAIESAPAPHVLRPERLNS